MKTNVIIREYMNYAGEWCCAVFKEGYVVTALRGNKSVVKLCTKTMVALFETAAEQYMYPTISDWNAINQYFQKSPSTN